jgi:hypothetical protein
MALKPSAELTALIEEVAGEGGSDLPADTVAALAGTSGTPSDTNRFVTDEDARLGGLDADTVAALAGTEGTPSGANPFVTDADPRLGSGLLASVSYLPAANVVISVVDATPTDVDATNLKVTFTAPASGRVLVGMSALCNKSGTNVAGYWLLRTVSGSAVVTGSLAQVISGTTFPVRPYYRVIISGLTPGVEYSWKWSHKTNIAGGSSDILIGNDNDAGGARGPAVMEVWSA